MRQLRGLCRTGVGAAAWTGHDGGMRATAAVSVRAPAVGVGLALRLTMGRGLTVLAGSAPALAQSSFINWETAHVSPLALTPDGSRLLAVNTPDNRLELLDVSGAAASSPRWVRS